ncbi:MAG: hypothetical protein U0837_02250 [Dehalococcoidia bacterium]
MRETFEQEYRIWFEIRGDEIEILVVFQLVLATCEGAGVAGEDSRFVQESISEAAAYLRRYSPNAAVRFRGEFERAPNH